MDNTRILEAFISTLKVKLSDATFRVAELETLLFLEQAKSEKLQEELQENESSDPSLAVKAK